MEPYGQKILYEESWKGPVSSKSRKNTSELTLFLIFSILSKIWFSLGFYVYIFENQPTSDDNSTSTIVKVAEDFGAPEKLLKHVYIKAGCIVLSVFLGVVYIFLLRAGFAKKLAWFVSFLFCCVSFMILIESTLSHYYDKKESLISTVISLVLAEIILSITGSCLKEKIRTICVNIRQSCKSITFLPLHLLIALSEALAKFFVLNIFINTHLALPSISSSIWLITLLRLYNIIELYWIWNFVSGVKKMIMSGAFATWYWSIDKKNLPIRSILRFLIIVPRYHLGTIAFGALVTPLCEIAYETLKLSRFLLKSVVDLKSSSFERFIGYMSSNAYVMCAIHGTNFITSGKNAFNLIMRNHKGTFVTPRVTKPIYWLGAISTIFIPLVLAHQLCIDNCGGDTLGVMVFILVHSIIITLVVFDVVNTAVDTVFICVLEDYERNDGSEDKPYFMSEKLKKIMLD